MEKFEVKEVNVTPEMAYQYLKYNVKNRHLTKPIILAYANDMINGRWKFTSQMITFDKDGILIDGQHRLAAVVKSKTTQKFLIARGGEHTDLFKNYDLGKKRNAGDALSVNGVKNHISVAAIIRKQLQLRFNHKSLDGGGARAVIGIEDVYSLYYKYNELYDEITSFSLTYSKKLKLYQASFIGGVIANLIIDKKHDEDIVYSFFKILLTSSNISVSVITALRLKILNASLNNQELSAKFKLAFLKKAWNCYVQNKDVKILRLNEHDLDNIDFI